VRKEFTYVPNARHNINRSRIDYFLISRDILTEVVDVGVYPHLSSTSFDHKKIKLAVGKENKKKNMEKINDTILKNKCVDLLVKTKVLESYLVHSDPDAVPRNGVYNLLEEIGRIDGRIRQIANIMPDAENADEQKSLLIEEAENIFETLPGLNYFLNLPLSCEDDFFFEGLISVVKSATLSIQADLFKTKNKYKKRLCDEIDLLKKDYNRNAMQIFDIENTLTLYIESELKSELENYKKFERLNNEKITPYFMRLVKGSNNTADLSKIKNDAGNAFQSDTDRENYITEFYKKLYEIPVPVNGQPPPLRQTLRTF
jgi:hypothetical protein